MVYNCSNNSIILSGRFVPAYLPLLLSNLSLGPSPFPVRFLRPRSARQPAVTPSPFPFRSAPPLPRRGLLIAGFPPPTPPRSLRFLPAFISIRAFPSAAASSRSVIIPSIPSRSFRPHIIKGCALTHAAAHVRTGAHARNAGPGVGLAALRRAHGIVSKSYN